MKCILCEKELKKNGNKRVICKDCIESIIYRVKALGGDFECYDDAVIITNCPNNLEFPELKNRI